MYIDDRAKIYENLSRGIPLETKLPFLSLVVSLAIIFILVVPEYKEAKMTEMRAELMKKNLKLKEDVVKKITDYNEINKDLDEKDIEKFSKLLPKENNIEEYVANIGDLAAINRIFISDFSVKRSDKLTEVVVGSRTLNLNAVEVNFSLDSDFTDLMSFLDYLERNIPLIDVNRLEISTKEKKENDFHIESDAPAENTEIDEKVWIEANINFLFYYL